MTTREKTGGRPMGKLHQDDVRKKIQVSQLLNVLQAHALSGEGDISPTRMKAIEILLKKSLPDLSAVTVSGNPDEPIQAITRIELVPLAGRDDGTG